MKKVFWLLIPFVFTLLTSCSKEPLPEKDFAQIASGTYKGNGATTKGEFTDELIRISRISETEIWVASVAEDGENAKIPGFQFSVDKHGAAIHQVLGTEDNRGTFTIDLAQAPNSIKFNLSKPNVHFSGVLTGK
jgi:hypothetical protein